MTLKPGLVFECPGMAREVTATWRGLAEEFLRQVERPELVQLLVTDNFEHAVQVWQRSTPSEFGDQGSADVYFASKVDGTRAAAKTVVLGEGQAVVIAAVGTLSLGVATARWMLTHEAQHVRLHQSETAAWGVHRRSGQEIVSPRPWVFIWSAQNAIDEYRCEAVTHSQLPERALAYGPDEFRVVLRHLDRARMIGVVEGDLEHAYEVVTQAVDRLAVLAAYSGAAIDGGRDTRQRWGMASAVTPVWSALRRSPSVNEPTRPAALWRETLQVSEALDQVLRRAGVELTFDDDQLALYFR